MRHRQRRRASRPQSANDYSTTLQWVRDFVTAVGRSGRPTCRGSGGCTGSESTVCAQTRAAESAVQMPSRALTRRVWSSDSALASSDSALASSDSALVSSDSALASCDSALRSCESALASCDSALRSCESALRNCEPELHGTESAPARVGTRLSAARRRPWLTRRWRALTRRGSQRYAALTQRFVALTRAPTRLLVYYSSPESAPPKSDSDLITHRVSDASQMFARRLARASRARAASGPPAGSPTRPSYKRKLIR